MDLNLAGRVILVTGGAAGIGEAISVELALERAISVIIDRNAAAIEQLIRRIESLGGKAYGIHADLTQASACAKAVQQVASQLGRIDGLVNNAGDNDGVSLEKGSYEAFVASLHKNLVHYYSMAQHALPYLIQTKGCILNISSKVAETGQGNTSAYAAANGGRNALTREWAVDLLPYKIRVNAVVVAESWTPLYEQKLAHAANPAALRASISQRIPLEHRMTTPQEIAHTALFLLSDCASHITGQLIHIDGGYVHLDRAISGIPTPDKRLTLCDSLKRLFR